MNPITKFLGFVDATSDWHENRHLEINIGTLRLLAARIRELEALAWPPGQVHPDELLGSEYPRASNRHNVGGNDE